MTFEVDKPWKRQLVLVVNEVDQEALTHDSEGKALLRNQNLVVLPLDERDFFNKFSLKGSTVLSSGSLLIQHPFDTNAYVDCSEARAIIGLERLTSAVELYQALGAKSVEIIQIRVLDKKTNTTAKGEFGSLSVSGELKAKYSEVQNLMNRIQLSYSFRGGNPDLSLAKRLLLEKRLDMEPVLQSLVSMCENSGNAPRSLQNELCLTEALEKTFEIAGKLNLPSGVVGANTRSVIQEKIAYYLQVRVNFE